MEEKVRNVGQGEIQSEEYIPPVQSANTLFRFLTQPEYLYSALEKQALIPRYYGENVKYLNIRFGEIYYPMVCFCDINIHRLAAHIGFYGKYGLAFSKPWGIKAGIQPIQYINQNSVLCKDISESFDDTYSRCEDTTENDVAVSSKSDNYLLTQMLFIKPINGQMKRDGEDVFRNFTDEREWRYVPDVDKIDFPPVIIEKDQAAVPQFNEWLMLDDCKACWLKFEYDDIKYIILPDQNKMKEFISFLDTTFDDEELKRTLIAKVIIWADAKEDF